jgi:hypothetical protein
VQLLSCIYYPASNSMRLQAASAALSVVLTSAVQRVPATVHAWPLSSNGGCALSCGNAIAPVVVTSAVQRVPASTRALPSSGCCSVNFDTAAAW